MTEWVVTTARQVVLPFEDTWIKSFGVKLFSVILESLFSVQLSRIQLASVSRYSTETSAEEPLRIQAEQLVLSFQSGCHHIARNSWSVQIMAYNVCIHIHTVLFNHTRRTPFDSLSDVRGYRRRISSELWFEKTSTYRQKSDPDNSLCGAARTERDSVGVNGPAFSMPTPVHAVTLIKSTKVKEDRDISAAIHPYFNRSSSKQPEQWREPSKLDQMFGGSPEPGIHYSVLLVARMTQLTTYRQRWNSGNKTDSV